MSAILWISFGRALNVRGQQMCSTLGYTHRMCCWILLCSEFPGANTMRIPHLSQFSTMLQAQWFLDSYTPHKVHHSFINLFIFPFTSNLENPLSERERVRHGIDMESTKQRDYSTNMIANWNSLENHWQSNLIFSRNAQNFRIPFNSIKFIDM